MLSAEERFERRDLAVGLLHVIVGSFEIVAAYGGVGVAHIAVHAIHGAENVAADIESLSLLLAANLLDAGAGGIGARFQAGELVMCGADFVRRGAGRCGRLGDGLR